ncbi:MAG: lipoyl(octanoyl) transferase LipB [Bacteroidota bacterium]|nr:lipoyl(octanoyl) transferase LipB [Bacteroidota bacterium]
MSKKVLFEDLGLIDYKEAWDYQEVLLQEMVSRKLSTSEIKNSPEAGSLIFCEHPHVYTIGRSGSEANLLMNQEQLKKIGASFYKINRGGDITYHGPGQLVGYPIFDLERLDIGVRKYVYLLEEAIIQALAEFHIAGNRLEGATGVWLDSKNPSKARKICAIGVRVSRLVSMHGFALNVQSDLDYFRYINPCGFVDKGVTSMTQENLKPVGIEEVKKVLKQKISSVFDLSLEDK